MRGGVHDASVHADLAFGDQVLAKREPTRRARNLCRRTAVSESGRTASLVFLRGHD